MTELWLPVNGFDLYEVSDQGRIRNVHRGTYLKGTVVGGWLQVDLFIGPALKQLKVHRLVAEAFIGPFFHPYMVKHIDGNKLNNKATNLKVITKLKTERDDVPRRRKSRDLPSYFRHSAS